MRKGKNQFPVNYVILFCNYVTLSGIKELTFVP